MRKPLKPLLLLFGFGLVVVLFWRADPKGVWQVVKSIGPWAPVFLCPYGLVYLVDTFGWRLSFGSHWPDALTFARLIRIRWAGESVNNLVPSGFLGGEAVKVYLLHKIGVSGWTGATSVVISKTVQTLAQVLFITFGALLGGIYLPTGSPLRPAMWATAGLSLAVFLVLIALQYAGFFKTTSRIAALSRRSREWLAKHRQSIARVDEGIRSFYHRQPRWFLASGGAYFAGWLCDTIEIWLLSAWLGWPIDWPRAAVIEAFIGVAKALGSFVPASLGVQESGVVLLFRAFGLTSNEALAYALLRRGRELVYALVGLGFLYREESSLKRLKVEIEQNSSS